MSSSHNFSNANIPTTVEGRVYHVGIRSDDVAPRILCVGDYQRARNIAKRFLHAKPSRPSSSLLTEEGKPVVELRPTIVVTPPPPPVANEDTEPAVPTLIIATESPESKTARGRSTTKESKSNLLLKSKSADTSPDKLAKKRRVTDRRSRSPATNLNPFVGTNSKAAQRPLILVHDQGVLLEKAQQTGGPDIQAVLMAVGTSSEECGGLNGVHEVTSSRGFTTFTGWFHPDTGVDGKVKPELLDSLARDEDPEQRGWIRLSICAIGMGLAMMDMFVREVRHVLPNETLTIIRLGSCGTMREEVPIGGLVIADGAVLIQRNYNHFLDKAPAKTTSPKCLGTSYQLSEACYPDAHVTDQLFQHLKSLYRPATETETGSETVYRGMNVTADTFYASQGRQMDAFRDDNHTLLEELHDFEFADGKHLMSLEMETYMLLHLGACSRSLGEADSTRPSIRSGSVVIVVANRFTNEFIEKHRMAEIEVEVGKYVLDVLAEPKTIA